MTAVILADGAFPENSGSLEILKNARNIICCDGAADSLCRFGLEPSFIVGDLDSVSTETRERFPERLFRISEQETNDLAKCFRFAKERNLKVTHLLGSSGKREDHLLGNLAQFAEFAKDFPGILLMTDYGHFAAVTGSGEFSGLEVGSQISFFSFEPTAKLTATGVQYPLQERTLAWWYEATLNTVTSPVVTLKSDGSMPVLVYFANR
ncbi:MAG: thiamine diphosphokinase [Lentisphaerae bacterium]|nr:thiamine diphosphokinase [Lentisphaerota bacterium]